MTKNLKKNLNKIQLLNKKKKRRVQPPILNKIQTTIIVMKAALKKLKPKKNGESREKLVS